MSEYLPKYKPVMKGVSIVGQEAYKDYRLTSTVRDPKKFNYYTDYRRITRKIWKRIAEDSVTYESGVYAHNFFYLVPQVVYNKPFVKAGNGKLKTNSHTGGDIYSPIFCNTMKTFKYFCWSVDGCFTDSFKAKLIETINKFVPKYYFILDTLLKNKI